jgi:hypothetical protein
MNVHIVRMGELGSDHVHTTINSFTNKDILDAIQLTWGIDVCSSFDDHSFDLMLGGKVVIVCCTNRMGKKTYFAVVAETS